MINTIPKKYHGLLSSGCKHHYASKPRRPYFAHRCDNRRIRSNSNRLRQPSSSESFATNRLPIIHCSRAFGTKLNSADTIACSTSIRNEAEAGRAFEAGAWTGRLNRALEQGAWTGRLNRALEQGAWTGRLNRALEQGAWTGRLNRALEQGAWTGRLNRALEQGAWKPSRGTTWIRAGQPRVPQLARSPPWGARYSQPPCA